MNLGKLLRWSTATAVLAGVLALPTLARAEADNFGLGNGHSGALAVTGTQTVNLYAGLTDDVAAGGTTLKISAVIPVTAPATTFAAGDLVMVWRSTGVAASEAPSGNQTKKVDLATALSTTSTAANTAGLTGTYEFARVQSVAGATVTLTAPLVNAFTKFVSQVVKVPEYTTVNVPAGASLVSTAFQEVNGNPAAPNPNAPWAGGIVIFLAQGTVTNAGLIHSNARGFHGATPPSRPLATTGLLNCDNNNLDGDSSSVLATYGQKGEGIIHSKFLAATGGKGNLSNAGGGGQCVEGGGGGGANGGNGGIGSDSVLGLGVGGYPGIAIDYDLASRLTMGGGGGAGRTIVALLSQVGFGGFGGGVVFIRAASMAGAGKLQANGGTGESSGIIGLPAALASEGSGGGGAGGTIVVRLTGTLDCDSIASPGGDGGNAAVIGLGLTGSGGGGGGGRVSYVATNKSANCKIIVTPGKNGGTGSDPGLPGVSDPPTTSECDAPYGAGTPTSCQDATKPVCVAGQCKPCDGNFGSGTPAACGSSTLNLCNIPSGSCGHSCKVDTECATTEWCAVFTTGGVCTPKTPNRLPLPPYDPIDGQCTVANGQRVCLSAVCEPSDDLCGYINSTPCPGGAAQCRSEICFTDNLCGFPNGHTCTLGDQCRSNICDGGICKGCSTDPECSASQICDSNSQTCVPGCRVGAKNTSTDGGLSQGACKAPEICVATDGGTIGQCQDTNDTLGIIEGGGCSCNTTPTRTASPFAVLGAVSSALLAWRRRKKRKQATSSTQGQG